MGVEGERSCSVYFACLRFQKLDTDSGVEITQQIHTFVAVFARALEALLYAVTAFVMGVKRLAYSESYMRNK